MRLASAIPSIMTDRPGAVRIKAAAARAASVAPETAIPTSASLTAVEFPRAPRGHRLGRQRHQWYDSRDWLSYLLFGWLSRGRHQIASRAPGSLAVRPW